MAVEPQFPTVTKSPHHRSSTQQHLHPGRVQHHLVTLPIQYSTTPSPQHSPVSPHNITNITTPVPSHTFTPAQPSITTSHYHITNPLPSHTFTPAQPASPHHITNITTPVPSHTFTPAQASVTTSHQH
ncbi:hypothetical protein E2C01_048329 [Portunus trituberculatus]|uniref:Uncharacterized protein n=1 Tax=Portunus trituberculatus TaxID=210409 RepID=A0A5B7GAV3_PORTR|nr:hypothetical protein [Portunus trituberculatus]